jgi:Zn-dependent peptidase ImmA (M78 family)/transcriptional regulator with XRE-family HTH domain
MPHSIQGERMRQLRLAIGATQADLSKGFDFESNSVISRLENGRGPEDASSLDRVAQLLGCSPSFLATVPADQIVTRPWLRAYADAPAKVVESVIADNTLCAEVVDQLGLHRIPESVPRFHDDLNDPEAIEDHAHLVRASAGIDEGSVVRNAVRAAERLGCVVLPLSDELGRHLGLSQYIDGVPHLRVSRPRASVPGDRQRFTVAHELGHLSLHAHLAPPATAEDARRIEQQAHRFAGAFLAPRDPLIEDLHRIDHSGRVTLRVLQELKSMWGVAIKMLVVRFQQLDVIDPAQATSLYKQISKRGWNAGEPVDVGHERPVWLSRALEKKWATDSAAQAGRYVGLDAVHLQRWLEWQTATDEGDVLPFDRHRRRPGSSTPEPGRLTADVTPLRPRR